MDKKIEKIRKTSRAITIVIEVAQVILVATIIFSIFNLFSNAGHYQFSYILIGISSLLGVLGLILLFFILIKLLASLRNGRTPFEEENIKRLKWVSLILIIIAAFQFLADAINAATWTIVQAPDVQGVAVATQTVAFQYSTLVMVILGLIIYCVAVVFQYGAVLQEQSDETL